MKRLLTITSVQSKMNFVEADLQNLISRRTTGFRFWKRKSEKKCDETYPGFENISFRSANVLLDGVVQISSASVRHERSYVLKIAVNTNFLITCMQGVGKNIYPAIMTSLS